MQRILIVCFLGFLFYSCGKETTVYVWEELEATNFDKNTQQALDTLLDSAQVENYVIKLDLNARIFDAFRSSGGFPASKNLQSNSSIDSIRIFSLFDFNDTLGADTAMITHFFTAQYPKEAGERRLALDFVRDFAKSDSVEGHFELFLEQKPQFDTQQFVIELDLSEGKTLMDTTAQVKFLD